MQMIQDGPYANAADKPLRMNGAPENCKVGHPCVIVDSCSGTRGKPLQIQSTLGPTYYCVVSNISGTHTHTHSVRITDV